MRRAFFADPPPDGAERYKDVTTYTWDESRNGTVLHLGKAWRGKQSKPYEFYRFRSPERRAEWVAEQRADADEREQHKAKRKIQDAQAVEKMGTQLAVGTILHCSWGYDQTNVDFFEIVERHGQVLWLREIAQETVRATGPMSAAVRPRPGVYIGPAIKKLIRPYGVTFPHGVGTPTSPDRSWHCSWDH